MTSIEDQDRIHNALRHPVRRGILRMLMAGETLSPSKTHERVGVALSHCAYHYRVLRELGLVRLERQEPGARNSVESFYVLEPEQSGLVREMLGEG